MTGVVRDLVAHMPHAPGVYRFREAGGRVMYIGRASDLRRRVGSYWGHVSSGGRLAAMVTRIARIEAALCDSEHEAAWLERNLLEQALPHWNRTPGGQEVPVYIRLDRRPDAPGLSVVHTLERSPDACYFGPYLGGDRVRLAVSGLHRVMPLAYTSDGASGSKHDMARVRGIGPDMRTRLIERISSVLEREADAVATVRAELMRRRENAASGLDFEHAARLQAELEAVEWVVAEQKVTVSEPHDVDVHGWADGVLVSFEVRAGRVCAWRQRACAQAVAQRRVAVTPTVWLEFAQRNAELAARLAR